MNRHRWIQGLGVAIAFVAITSLARATFATVVDPGLQFLGQWHWNTATSATVKTRVRNLTCSNVLVLVDVKARAVDGTTVGRSVVIPLGPQAGREVTQVLSKPITPLQFVQLRFFPANGPPPCPCRNHEEPGSGL